MIDSCSCLTNFRSLIAKFWNAKTTEYDKELFKINLISYLKSIRKFINVSEGNNPSFWNFINFLFIIIYRHF